MSDLLNNFKKICQKNNIAPVRAKGQNFLINEDVYDKIIAAADLHHDDIVLEVGPGLGILTEKLAAKVKQVIAVEVDDKLADLLRANLAQKGIGNVKVVNDDVLKAFGCQLSAVRPVGPKSLQLKPNSYKVVANLPYNITSFFLRKFLSEPELRPESMVLLLQKEVAERIIAQPPKMSLLALSAQFYAEPEIIAAVLRNDFWPVPEVESAIIKFKIAVRPAGSKSLQLKADSPEKDEKKLFHLAKIGFSSKRKMLKNNLSAGLRLPLPEVLSKLKQVNFSEKIRAQELSLADWIKLSGLF